MKRYISMFLVLLLCFSFSGCGNKSEELFSTWIVGHGEFSVPIDSMPMNMREEGVEYCGFQAGELYVLVSAVPLRGLFSLSDFDKEDADAYLEELKAPDKYGYAPVTAELIIAGELPYYLLGYSYEDTGSWVVFHTILDGMAYDFCGWRPGDRIVEEDIEFLWGTASTLESIPLEMEETEE